MAWFGAWGVHLLAAAPEGLSEPSQVGLLASLMEGTPFPLLMTAAALTFLATLVASKFADKLHVPAALGVLLLGALINPSDRAFGPEAIENLHIITLTMLLFYAGLKTNLKNIRQFLSYGLLLSIAGVMLSTLVFAAIITAAFSLGQQVVGHGESAAIPWGVALLIAASLGCTDGGATYGVLSSIPTGVPKRLKALLEFESSLNAPVSILLVLLIAGFLTPQASASADVRAIVVPGIAGDVQGFIKSIGSGIMVGLILTYVGQYVMRHIITSRNQILMVGLAIAMASYGMAALLGGSGFISAYVTGLFLANNIYDIPLISEELLDYSLEPFNTLMEMMVFLLFGVIVNPANIQNVLLEGTLGALGLMLVARPVSVWLLNRLSPFTRRESMLIGWCGLRGAVPLALTYTTIHTIHEITWLPEHTSHVLSQQIEGFIFLVVLLSLSLQGLSLPWLTRSLGLSAAEAKTAEHPA